MIALYGATIGKLGILTIDAATNQAVCGIFVPEGVETKYLFYFLLQHRPELIKQGAGGAQPNISQGIIRDIEVPLPPLPEQRRIVARIEELFSRLDAGVAALRHAKAQLQRYRQSVLAAAVTGALPGLKTIHPDSWQPISGIIKTLDQGWSPKCESVPAGSDDEWAVIKTTAIQAGYFLDQENKKLPIKLEPRGHLELKIGDLLLTRAGPRSRVGVACYVRKVRPKLMLCDKAYRVRLEPKKATPGFIELVLNSPRFVDALDEMKSGISDSGLNLTQKRFAELLIPLPSLAEQQQIVAEVEARTTAIDHLEAELDRQITRSNRLRQSTLSSAFSGQL
jgi:type I restriction enzyme S subunit